MAEQKLQPRHSTPAYAVTAGTSTEYTATIANLTLQTGQMVSIKPHTDCGASPTLNINGLGAKALKKDDGTALASGDIKSTGVYTFVYDGTDFFFRANVVSGSGNLAYNNGLTYAEYFMQETTQTGLYGTYGVYNTTNDIYFFGGIVWGNDNYGKLFVGKYNKSTKVMTTFTSQSVRFSVSISSMELRQSGGVIYFADGTLAQSLQFNTATDTFSYGTVFGSDTVARMAGTTTSTSGLLSLAGPDNSESITRNAVVAAVSGTDIKNATYNDGTNTYTSRLTYAKSGAVTGALLFKAYIS